MFAEADQMAGWGQLILQGGAFALLVYIVTVMYPKSVTESREEREKRDSNFTKMLDSQQEKFGSRNLTIVAALERQTSQLGEKLDKHTEGMNRALLSVCRVHNQER